MEEEMDELAATREDRSEWIDPDGKNQVECYVCGEDIEPTETDWGFTWGSDGVFPDGASAMYCCKACRSHWIDS
jgi:hypothetical protein